jgi:hypothetical protein
MPEVAATLAPWLSWIDQRLPFDTMSRDVTSNHFEKIISGIAMRTGRRDYVPVTRTCGTVLHPWEEAMTRIESFAETRSEILMARRREQMPRTIRRGFGLLLGAVLLVVSLAVGNTSAVAQFAGPTPLTLVNGWAHPKLC